LAIDSFKTAEMTVKGPGLPWVWGFPWRLQWVCVWYGYGDCDESPWVLWVICGDFELM